MKVRCPYCNKYMRASFDTFANKPTRNCKCGFHIQLPRDALYRPEMFIKFGEAEK